MGQKRTPACPAPLRAAALAALLTVPLLARGGEVRADDARAISEVEAAVRRYYDYMQNLDFEGMRAMSTDEFEILDRGYRYGHYPFQQQMISSRRLGVKLVFQLQEFRTRVAADTAWTSYVTLRPGYRFDGVDSLILRRIGDRWRVDRFMHMRMVDGTDPHRVPGGQKRMASPAVGTDGGRRP